MQRRNKHDQKFEKDLERARYTSAQGKIIPLHHAFQTILFTRMSKVSMVLLPAIFMAGLWMSFDEIAGIWEAIFGFWMQRLFVDGAVAHRDVTILWHQFSMPYPALSAGYPSSLTILLNIFICFFIFMFTFNLFKKWAPLVYLVRAALLIQSSATIYFALNPNHFPYELGGYIIDMLSLGLYLLFLVPLVYAAVLYIFNFPLWWKIAMTVLPLVFFIIFLPFQYMVHAWIVHHTSYMFLPLIYFMFSVLLDVLMFICFYSISMAWAPYTHKTTNWGRYA
jgi:hypothetical protein